MRAINDGPERRSATVRDGARWDSSWRVEEPPPVADHREHIHHFPPPSSEQAAALQTVSQYLNQAGTRVASFLLGFPPHNGDTATLAEFSTLLLRIAALCDVLLERTDSAV